MREAGNRVFSHGDELFADDFGVRLNQLIARQIDFAELLGVRLRIGLDNQRRL